MSKNKDLVVVEGTVIDVLPNSMFKIEIDNKHTVTAYTGGKMKQFKIKLVVGDKVRMEMSPYDLTKGRITYRM